MNLHKMAINFKKKLNFTICLKNFLFWYNFNDKLSILVILIILENVLFLIKLLSFWFYEGNNNHNIIIMQCITLNKNRTNSYFVNYSLGLPSNLTLLSFNLTLFVKYFILNPKFLNKIQNIEIRTVCK